MYQKIIVMGHLGQDPEMRYMPDGTAVTNFSIATSRRWTDGNSGEQREETTWFRCSVWGKSAETVQEYFSKGKPILVEGRIKPDPATGGPRTFTRQDGTVGASFEINVDKWSFAGKGDEDSGGSGGGHQAVREDDEIPF